MTSHCTEGSWTFEKFQCSGRGGTIKNLHCTELSWTFEKSHYLGQRQNIQVIQMYRFGEEH
jgi:hypothetical protein